MSQYIEVPDETEPLHPGVFLAGGITAVEDWQREARTLIENAELLSGRVWTVYNPRFAEFDVMHSLGAEQQIGWEHNALTRSEWVLFWFPACDPTRTVQPIALFELGNMAARGANIVVGCDPQYPRRLDVVLQLKLIRPDVTVRESLREVVADLPWTGQPRQGGGA